MRWLYLTVVVLFVAATILFALQNVEPVTMSFLECGIRAPLAVIEINVSLDISQSHRVRPVKGLAISKQCNGPRTSPHSKYLI